MPLEAIASALPTIRDTAQDIADATGADEAFVRTKIGVGERFRLGEEETGVQLAANACETLIKRTGTAIGSIDVLVFVTQTPDRRLPQNSSVLAHKLGMSASTAAFDIALGCSGYVYGLAITEAFLKFAGRDRALLITCDPYSRIISKGDRATNTLFGDAATASLISRNGSGGRLCSTDFGTDGSGADAIQIPNGGAQMPIIGAAQRDMNADEALMRLKMSGRDVFNFVLRQIPASIDRCLKINGLTRAEIDYFALHQGSAYMLDALCEEAKLPKDRVIRNLSKVGNTVSSSIPLLLEPLLDSDKVRYKTILISGYGVGLSWATSVIRF